MQKFQKFLDKVMDGTTSLEQGRNQWVDCQYYSSIVGGNPNRILLGQLLEQRRTGKSAAPIKVSQPLPPYIEAGKLINNIFSYSKVVMYLNLLHT